MRQINGCPAYSPVTISLAMERTKKVEGNVERVLSTIRPADLAERDLNGPHSERGRSATWRGLELLRWTNGRPFVSKQEGFSDVCPPIDSRRLVSSPRFLKQLRFEAPERFPIVWFFDRFVCVRCHVCAGTEHCLFVCLPNCATSLTNQLPQVHEMGIPSSKQTKGLSRPVSDVYTMEGGPEAYKPTFIATFSVPYRISRGET